MNIKNRLFPYPVLCVDTDDYVETADFLCTPNNEVKTHEIILSYEYEVKCDAIDTLIRNGSAEFVLHIECPNTSYRKALSTSVPLIELRIPKAKVNGEISIIALVVAKKEIKRFVCQDLNEDYKGIDVSFKKGEILAYLNLPSITVTKKSDELASDDSFFTVIKQVSIDPDEIQPLTFNLNSDKIQIMVDQRTYEAFVKHQHSKSIAIALLVFPALTYMVNELKLDPDGYSNYDWFQKLSAFYRSQGKDFLTDIINQDENPVSISQEMLKNPISNAYRDLMSMED